MEVIVENVMDSILNEVNPECRCDDCLTDMKAIALNILPSRYVATDKGEVFTRIDALQLQHEVDVVRAVTWAAEIVSKHPRHDAATEN